MRMKVPEYRGIQLCMDYPGLSTLKRQSNCGKVRVIKILVAVCCSNRKILKDQECKYEHVALMNCGRH